MRTDQTLHGLLRYVGLGVILLFLFWTVTPHAQPGAQVFQNLTVTGQLLARAASPATSGRTGVPSASFSLLGSGWDAAAGQPVDVGLTLQTRPTDAGRYQLSILTQRGAQLSANPVLTLGHDGNLTLSGFLTVSGLATSRFTGDLSVGTSRDPALLTVSGAVSVSDVVKARLFQGSGAELTDLSASQIKGVLQLAQLPSIPATKILGTLDISQLPRDGYHGTYVRLSGDTMTGRLRLPFLQVAGRGEIGEDLSVTGSLTVSQSVSIAEGLGVAGARPDASRNESLAVGGGARFLGSVEITQTLRARGTATLDSNLTVGANATVNGNLTVRGNGTVGGDLTVNGEVTASAFHGLCKADPNTGVGCQDIAELFDATEPVLSGQLVVLDLSAPGKVKPSSRPYELHLVGVAVAQPGIVLTEQGVRLGRDAARLAGEMRPAVALVGRARVAASNENGAVRAGDPLTSSSVAGIAMKATRAGRIIGFALENFDTARGSVLILLNPGFFMSEESVESQP